MDRTMQEMIDWIEDHLFEDFSLASLGRDMGYSPYYCSFKFHQMTGITIKRYKSLRKMYLASMELKETQQKTIDLAFKYGFLSQEAFTRAFKGTFGISPSAFRKKPQPLQTYLKFKINRREDGFSMDISQKWKIGALQDQIQNQFDHDILNILNGQMMYEEFYNHQLMEKSDYVPFNEAMCSNETTVTIFSDAFIQTRASGHRVSLQEYEKITVIPLKPLFENSYKCMVLWFGDDMFCQINLLTVLAYLEQARFDGKVYFHMVNEMTYEVEETEIRLEGYQDLYEQVLIHHRMPEVKVMPVMYQGIRLYLDYLKEDNEITTFIKKHIGKPQDELLQHLFHLFPHYGLGDLQYIKIIEALKKG
ncbi:helix-turn-helix transcriptional regulator [Paenibacillus sp. MWE-103]|uniref:Helix-turn-helix transcriptional regulator n=1 Tax=Paenibacillus artemisiicola TaxID=1172618 RepID=A0ABS3W7V1_9BACL|nr:AraC family transcriptional regulator [Paenibacillus artemisiicola]MBO7744396.1 helix-turn-helix transcriptional regulator [Paenibacillus artemisiicola]